MVFMFKQGESKEESVKRKDKEGERERGRERMICDNYNN